MERIPRWRDYADVWRRLGCAAVLQRACATTWCPPAASSWLHTWHYPRSCLSRSPTAAAGGTLADAHCGYGSVHGAAAHVPPGGCGVRQRGRWSHGWAIHGFLCCSDALMPIQLQALHIACSWEPPGGGASRSCRRQLLQPVSLPLRPTPHLPAPHPPPLNRS